MLTDEREAMRELLTNYKLVTNQRNGLLSLNKEYVSQVSDTNLHTFKLIYVTLLYNISI